MSAESFIQDGVAAGYIHPTDSVETLTIDGHRDSYNVYEVRLDKLKYNVRNGRIAPPITGYKREHGELPPDGSEELNAIIEKFIEADNPMRLKKTKIDIKKKGQQRPAVILSDGTVIDGNRRYTCLRQLSREEGEARYLRCFVLDSALDEKSLKGLELELQFGQDEKVGYDPVARLVDIYIYVINGDLEPDYYRTKSGMTKAEMDSFLEQARLMVEFLDFIDAEGEFYIVQDLKLQGPLNELHLTLKKCHDDDKREDIKTAMFTTMLVKSGTDVTRRVREMGKITLDPDFGDDFLDEQVEIAQTVLEHLQKVPAETKVDIPFIRDVIRADTETAQQLDDSFSQAQVVVNNKKIKNGQLRQLKNAKSGLEKVIPEIFPKIDTEILVAMKRTLEEIRTIVDKQEASINETLSGRA